MMSSALQKVIVLFLVSVFWLSSAPAQNSRENAEFKLAINLYNDGLYDLAAEQLKQFIAAFPNTAQGVEARFYLGLTQLKLKQYEDARLTFQTFALTYQDNPRAPEAWWNVGEAYAALGNTREAALAFERVKVFHPKHKNAPEALVKAASAFREVGERDNARRLLRAVLQEYPSSSAVLSARTSLGRMYFEDGNLELAQSELRRVIEGDPSSEARAQALLILGDIRQTMGRTDQALEHYQEIVSKYKSSSAVQGAYIHIAALSAQAGKTADAIDNLKKSLAITKNVDSSLTRKALGSLGDAYMVKGDFTQAIGSYDRFLAVAGRADGVETVLWKQAVAYARSKNFRKSDELCSRLVKSNAPMPLRRTALLQLAQNAREAGRPALALQHYDQWMEQFPEESAAPDVLLRMGSIAETTVKDFRRAATCYQLLITRYPRSPLVDDAVFGMARCLEHVKEPDRALAMYRELIRTYPASDFRAEAESTVRRIETFEARDKDAGLEKLALIIGDVVAEKNRAGLSLRLGEIYFQDLKNYEAAAAQFTAAIASGTGGERLPDAYFLLARSLEALSLKNPARIPEALTAYHDFVQRYPADRRLEEAALAIFLLSARTAREAQTAYAASLAICPGCTRRDTMLLVIGKLQVQADSLVPALSTFSEITRVFEDSPSAEEASFRQCMGLFTLQDPDSASGVGNRHIVRYPGGRWTADLLQKLAQQAVDRKSPERAIDLLQRLTNEFYYTSAASSANRLLADAYLEAGNTAAAISAYRDILDQYSLEPATEQDPDPLLLVGLGKAYAQSGNTKDAKSTLLRVLANERTGSSAAEAYSLLGMIAKEEGSLEVATSYFRQAGLASPATAANKDVAALLFANGQYPEALVQYKQLAQDAPTIPEREFYDSRAIISLMRSDQLSRAESEIRRFIASYPQTDTTVAMFEVEKGQYLFRQNDYARALAALEQVASKYEETPSAPVASYWIGKVYEATSRPQEAIAQLQTLLQRYPGSPMVQKAHLTLGNIAYRLERWDAAIQHYRVLVDSPDTDPALLPFAMSNLIETYETAGVNDAALALTRRYLERFPNAEDSFDKRIKIGILYQRLGYYDQSVLHLQSLLDEAGSDLEGEIRYYIAEANYHRGDYQQAILDFLKVPYLVTKKGKIDWTANALYMCGQSYEKMGRPDQALTMYKQIVERSGIDETFRSAARKEIDRVNLILKKNPK